MQLVLCRVYHLGERPGPCRGPSSANNRRQMAEWKVDISRGRHSFPFVYGIREEGMTAEWLVWHSKATVAQKTEALFEQRSIINQCVGEEGEITRAVRVVLTNKANRSRQWMHTDKRLWLWHWPVPNIQIRVHLVGRLVLFMSAAPSHIISALSSAALSSLTHQLCPRSVNKTHDKPPKRTLYTYICAFSDNVTTIKS